MENKANIYVGVTDNDWYNYLANSQPDELNFWQRVCNNFRVNANLTTLKNSNISG